MGKHEQALMMEGAPHQEKMQAGDLLAAVDQESATSQTKGGSPRSYCLTAAGKRTCLLMTCLIAFILAASLVAVRLLRVPEQGFDACFDPFKYWTLNLQPSNYRLFSTKTSYTAALSHLVPELAPQFRHKSQYKEPTLDPFTETYSSTEKLHQELAGKRGCRVRQLHFIGRHGANYPSADETQNIILHLSQVQSLIDLDKYAPPSPAGLQSVNGTSITPVSNTNVTAKACFNPLITEYKQLPNFLLDSKSDRLMYSGAQETQAMALRYLNLYHDLLSPTSKTNPNLRVGVTEEELTSQTAINFLSVLGLLNTSPSKLNLESCDPSLLEKISLGSQEGLQQVYESRCLKNFAKTHFLESLQFDKVCDRYRTENSTFSVNYANMNLTTEPWLDQIAASVAKKLKLDNPEDTEQAGKEAKLTRQHLKSIYKTCKYETALNTIQGGESIWCNLFTESQLHFLEYVDDAKDYITQVNGDLSFAKSACMVTGDIMDVLRNFQKKPQDEVRLYFTNARVIERLIAATINLNKDPGYRPAVMRQSLLTGTTPNSIRNWRSSLMSPFSANFAFTVYDCHNATQTEPKAHPSLYKVVASLNERPFMMGGCSHIACDLDQFLTKTRFNIDNQCNIEDICYNNPHLDS